MIAAARLPPRSDRQRRLAARHQRQPGSQMGTYLSGSSGTGFTRFRPVEAGARHPTQSANVCQHRSPFWPADAHSKVAILKSRRVRRKRLPKSPCTSEDNEGL